MLGDFAIDQNGDTNQGSMTIDVAKGGKLVTYKVLTPPCQSGGDVPLAMEATGERPR